MTQNSLDAYILIVDDELPLTQAVAEELSLEGYRVVTANSASEALTALKQHKVFLVIADLNMPGVNGLDLCGMVRKEFPGIPYILLTGFADRDAAIKGLKLGVNDLISKPYERQELFQAARKYYDAAVYDADQLAKESLQIKAIFVEEAKDIMADFESSILFLEENPGDMTSLDRFFRKLHTLKGSAASVTGGEQLSKLAHGMENVLSAIKEGKQAIDSRIISIFLHCQDLIIQSLNAMESGTVGPKLDEAILTIHELLKAGASGPSTKPEEFTKTPQSLVKTAVEAEGDDGVMVTADKLDRFMDLAGDLVAFKNGFDGLIRYLAQGGNLNLAHLDSMNRSIMKISESIQTQIMDVRKVALSKVFTKFPRVVRQAASELGKQIRLELLGQELAVDKTIAKALGACLIHAVRNSCDHGIESPAERREKGKDPAGTIRVLANQMGNTISIIVCDDGAGLDRRRIVQKALEKSLIDQQAASQMSDTEAYELLFLPGFSTKDAVTNLSGRGVGMDVIKTAAVNLGGTATLDSTPGQGMVLTLQIPVPSSVVVEKSLLVKSDGVLLALPLSSVAEIKSVSAHELTMAHGHWTLDFRGSIVDVGVYRDFIEGKNSGRFSGGRRAGDGEDNLVVVLCHKSRLLGLMVDAVLDQIEAVIRPFDSMIKALPGFCGTTMLPNNDLAFVLSPEDLMNCALDQAV